MRDDSPTIIMAGDSLPIQSKITDQKHTVEVSSNLQEQSELSLVKKFEKFKVVTSLEIDCDKMKLGNPLKIELT